MHIAGYSLAVFAGLCLALMGGGGSILVVPILVGFFSIDPVIATTYSLFIVGMTAFSGTVSQYRSNNIDFSKLLLFGVPSILVLFGMRKIVMPAMPEKIFKAGNVVITKPVLIMSAFLVLMFIAAARMIRHHPKMEAPEKIYHARLILQGGITGAITGFIGIGGGFIIVPSLVLFAGMQMKKAAATSLAIIVLNCAVGLASSTASLAQTDLWFLTRFCTLTVSGILAGTWLVKFIPDRNLKPLFGWIVLASSTIIMYRLYIALQMN
ncbi:sulfite exporter TauE/SafE family protein [Pollutibacter soli]|uniref:sulfite exporter TauE/SafE family protein n=1 Tax=Pollutibacter soli TaxID=3034157 RepID=UPI0030133CAF